LCVLRPEVEDDDGLMCHGLRVFAGTTEGIDAIIAV
jgi:hypothetical protein